MNIIYPNLYNTITAQGISYKKLAEVIDVELELLLKKMQGVIPFTLPEAMLISVYLKEDRLGYLFFQLDINT